MHKDLVVWSPALLVYFYHFCFSVISHTAEAGYSAQQAGPAMFYPLCVSFSTLLNITKEHILTFLYPADTSLHKCT